MYPHFKHTVPALALSLIALSTSSRAATYNWLATRPAGLGTGEGLFNRANYATPEGGVNSAFTPTSADVISLNTGARAATVNAAGTIGQLSIGSGYGVTNVNQTNGNILTIQSGGVADAGVQIQSGRTGNTNIHARVNFQGDVTIANNGDSRVRFGNPGDLATPTGNGGIQGSGTLAITKGTVLLGEYLAGGHTYSGAVTVTGSNSVLQVAGGGVFNTYSSLTVVAGASITGGGTFGSADLSDGGRVSPGAEGGFGAGPNTLTFTNLLNLQATGLAVLDIRAAGTDSINVTAGTINLGGELRLRLNSDYAGEGVYQLFTGLTPSSGNFDTVTIQTDANTVSAITLEDDNGDGQWDGYFASRGYGVSFDANTGLLNLTSIPEPHTFGLSLIATGFLFLRRGRRQTSAL
ncbi:hypothetical protein JIN84_20505 [Luteolibacter yonseiensis]|uniref:PEP-CTERM protein-sorting domain-containing protein n=1 Tax=Luteolibacter yonseiensis TaxID=1144680 RepID=A0A934VDH1_9BACT|nr:hypothetical protein [Luteolibacter yonseiensis]MBK1818016.1 hypothetical protein [Luteolibacter yonseiensis]